MRRLFFVVLMVTVFFYPAAVSSLTIRKVNVSPLIDGHLEEFWQQTTKADLKEYEGNKLKNKTIVYLAYDKQNLYLAFRCFEGQMDKLKTVWNHYEERDNSIWNDDCIEVFLDPFSSRKDYYHLIINSAGVIYDSEITDSKNTDILWDSDIKVATSLGKDFWIVEMAVPFSDFGYFPVGGENWRGNLCREEKPDKELSCLSPTYGGFCNPEKFTNLSFQGRKEGLIFSLNSFAEDKINLSFNNQSNSAQKLKFIVNSFQKGERFFLERKEVTIPVSEKKEVILPYKTKLGEQTTELVILNLTENKLFYRNRFSLLKKEVKEGESRRVWNVKKPLYRELFSEEPAGLAKEGAIYWLIPRKYWLLRPFALQYGLRYIYDEVYQQCARNKLHPFFQIANYSNLTDLLDRNPLGRNAFYYDRKHKVKEIIFADPRGANAPAIDGSPFLLDPIVTKYYLDGISKILKENADVIWAISAGDEVYEIHECIGIELFKKMKNSYPFIKKADQEIKEKYGAGKYGIPLSLSDTNPYRWIAYRRWLNEKMAEILGKLYKTVKETHPEIYVISYDSTSYHHPYDFGLWRGKCDILTNQLYPRCTSHRAKFGFVTKLIKDISEVKEVWPCGHIENYAASFTPEEVLELLSQVFRNGGNGFHYYLCDTIGRRAKKKYMYYEYYGAPERWQIEMELVKEAGRMKKLRFPEPDFAILYSCDSYASQPPGFSTDEIEYVYTFLGPNAKSWFSFIDDNQIYRKEKNLSSYKTIYIPFAKYERLSVVEELEEYIKKGGILISGDPQVFSLDTVGNKIDNYREKLFGIKIKGETSQREIKYKDKSLPIYSSSYDIVLLAKTKVLTYFPDGKPAIVEHSYGKGKTIYFASNPFTKKGITNQGWKDFFKELQTSLKIKTNQDIWRFKFPLSLIKKPPVPKGKCLTNNHIFWYGNEPINFCNFNTKGDYSYSLYPDKIKDEGGDKKISFSSGDLTDRRKAPTAGNVECGKSKLSDWIVSWEKPAPFNITFDFKKAYNISKIRLFYSGQLPALSLSGSRDGKNWKELDAASPEESFTKDVLDKTLTDSFGSFQYLRIKFGKRGTGKYLTLSEIEVWRK